VDYVREPYYAGLWNAVGSACPKSLVFSNFEEQYIWTEDAGNPIPIIFRPPKLLSFTLTFLTGMDQIDPQDKESWDNLDEAAKSYKENQPAIHAVTVKVIGSATRSELGQKDSGLAEKRVEYVVKQLTERKVDPMRIAKGVEKEPSDSALGKVTISIQP
jgi:outer membrane protein OmpA-like peptidoglycan-associated protein